MAAKSEFRTLMFSFCETEAVLPSRILGRLAVWIQAAATLRDMCGEVFKGSAYMQTV